MAKDEVTTLRRGKPETRGNFERAKYAFDNTKGDTKVAERLDQGGTGGCPTCHGPMLLIHSYRGESYRFAGICQRDASHNVERYGFVQSEGTD